MNCVKSSAASAKSFSLERVSFRNIKTDFHRIALSVISLTGAVVVVIMGFSVRFGIAKTLDYQKNVVINYDADMRFDDNDLVAADEMTSILAQSGMEYMYSGREYIKIKANDGTMSATLSVADMKNLTEYMVLRDSTTRETIADSKGLYISQKFARKLSVKAGDHVTVQTESGNVADVVIGAVFDSYFGVDVYMSPESYSEAFDSTADVNNIMIKQNNSEMPVSALEAIDGYGGYEPATYSIDFYEDFMHLYSLIMVIMLGFALVMEAVLILAIVDMQISEKRHELTIMEHLGYNNEEIKRYLRTEAYFTSVPGMLIGAIAGYFAAMFILDTLGGVYASFITVPTAENIIIPIIILAVYYTVIYFCTISMILKRK